ncbi:MAG: ABC transporter permease [Oscillibacter sp.]|nr:ABC transporter permease [Oscillibacter sp.]
MSQGKRVAHAQTAVRVIGQRSYRASRTSNRLIAAAAIIVVILITATCNVFFNLQSFSALQDLKSYGTTTDVIFSSPTVEQLTRLEENEQVQKPLYVSYKLGRLIGNAGQSGLSMDLYAVDNWDTWSSLLVEDFQGHYPTEANEVMMSTWLLKRFGIEPAAGTEITLSVGWDDRDAAEEETFRLSGFYTDTSYINTAAKQQVFLSTAALSQHDLPAAIVGFSFTDGSIQKNLDQITEQLGLTEQQLVTVLSGRQMSLRDAALALAVILFFMADGFLIIYNINSISVTRDVQFYGLLKTIGISPRQLKRVIYYRMGRVLMLALPAGLLLGCAVTQWIVPLLLGDLLEGFTQADFHWAVPVASALFSCGMIFVSFAMTARKVRFISPMAALRYTEEGIKGQTSRSTDHAALPWMGLKNAFRHPVKAFFVIGTFFLSSVTFLLCMTVLEGLSVDEYVNFNTAHDVALYNHMSRASFSPQEEQSFTPEIMARLRQMEGVEALGVTKVVPIYEQYSPEVYGDWYQIKSDFERESGGEPTNPQVWIDSPKAAFWSLLVGVDREVIEAYNQSAEVPVDLDAFERGEFLLTTDMNGNGLRQGDTMTFFVMDTDRESQLPIGGRIPLERDGMNGGAAPWLVVSNQVIDQYRPDAIIYSIKIDNDPACAQSILDQVRSLTEHIPAISRTSRIELAESLAEAKSSLSKLSAFLTIVLFSIGILNFINTMSANILNRQKEFAAMEAVGATRRQVRGMIVWEGFWYFASTMALALTIGSAADVLLFAAIQNSLGFGAFHYPGIPFVLYMLLALALCGAIPAVIYQKAGTGSIVERLREN